VPDLADLCVRAVQAAPPGQQVEAYGQEGRRTQVRARAGEIESLSFAESRGVGVRVVADGRVGYAYAADPDEDAMLALVRSAGESSTFAEPDEANVLPIIQVSEPLLDVYREEQAGLPTERKVAMALELERLAVSVHPEVRKVESASYGDSVARVVLASTRGGPVEYSRTDAWVVVSSLAERDGETQTGFSFDLAREMSALDWEGAAAEAAERAARLLGGTKPGTRAVPVILDPVVGASFLGFLSAAVSAEAVQKGRSPLADLVGQRVAAPAFTVVDDGRLMGGPAVAPFDDEGVATGRTVLVGDGVLRGFLHNTYTATKAKGRSTGNAGRSSYRSVPGVSPSNLFVEPGPISPEDLVRQAGDAVYVQEVSGLHSGANPVSGQFSVGAVGLRVRDGVLGEPLREMTIASTLLDVLNGVVARGSDLRFFPGGGGLGSPTMLIGEMTVAGT
jgi:PmbA protein